MNKEFISKVAKIQLELKAPKTQYNKFGDYNYRNLEDILTAIKPILNGLVLTVSDDIKLIGNEIYVFSTATLTDGESSITNTAAARETMIKKKYDSSQLTGSASSYARKYCLNGLFNIDDTRDADGQQDNGQQPAQKNQKQDEPVNWYQDTQFQNEKQNITEAIRGGMPPSEVIKNLQGQGFAINKKIRAEIEAI